MPLIKEWFSAAEIASARLTGMPTTARRVLDVARRQGWQRPIDEGKTWRKRVGRGGGVEFHVTVLPPTARVQMQAQHRVEGAAPAKSYAANPDREALWNAYLRLTGKKRIEAERRLTILCAVEDAERSGLTQQQAMLSVCAEYEIVQATYYNWRNLVLGVARSDWLPHLAPQHKGSGKRADICDDALTFMTSYFASQSKPPVAKVLRDVRKMAKAEGWSLPGDKTLERRLKEIMHPLVVAATRGGPKALDAMLPAQRRDRSAFAATQAVNADGHKFDVRVDWGNGAIGRPLVVVFQDLYSNKILSWCMGASETSEMVRLAYGDMAEKFGIPEEAYFDNGMAFASKGNTGGTERRFRGKHTPDETEGLLLRCGTTVTFVKPAHGQSKPIERAFGDLANNISKDARCDGAYTGNSTQAKPENYGSKAVPFAIFRQVVAEGIAEYNARPGRNTKAGGGKLSFDEVFAASCAAQPFIVKLPRAQRDLWLLTTAKLRVRPDATVHVRGQRYHAEFLYLKIGWDVTVRFDPRDVTAPVQIYDAEDRLLGHAEFIPDTAFNDADAAETFHKAKGQTKKRVKALAKVQAPHSQSEVAAMLATCAPAATPEVPEGRTVLRPVFGNTVPKAAETADRQAEREEAEIRFMRAVGDHARALQRRRDEGG